MEKVAKLPILALDVDGPLVLMGQHQAEEVFEIRIGEIPVSISRRLPGRLLRLSAHFQVVWSTSWGRKASYQVAPAVGLPQGLPHIDFDRYPRARPGESRKMPGLRAWLKDLPVAIVDDEMGEDMRQWAAQRSSPTLLVEVDPRYGLQDSHVEELLNFAARLRNQRPWA